MKYRTLRAANNARQSEWDGDGHAMNDDWRMNELMGEAGEVCNILKKLHRERVGVDGSRADRETLADELADVVICLDLFLGTKRLSPATGRIRNIEPGKTLTRRGRDLFSAVARLDTVSFFHDAEEIGSAANAVYSHCLILAQVERIDLRAAVAKKFNETSFKRDLNVSLVWNP